MSSAMDARQTAVCQLYFWLPKRPLALATSRFFGPQLTVHIPDVLHEMVQEGYEVTTEIVATFSPYAREHIKRFGEYVIDLEMIPPPLQPDKPFLSPVAT
ncbi:MAG: Tn3 family transposase [Chloroflexi bacterium]|nr:Tn3 family transposase [Chloroflexota bacterium]